MTTDKTPAKIINHNKDWSVLQCPKCKSTITLAKPLGSQYRCAWCGEINKINLKTVLLAKKGPPRSYRH